MQRHFCCSDERYLVIIISIRQSVLSFSLISPRFTHNSKWYDVGMQRSQCDFMTQHHCQEYLARKRDGKF